MSLGYACLWYSHVALYLYNKNMQNLHQRRGKFWLNRGDGRKTWEQNVKGGDEIPFPLPTITLIRTSLVKKKCVCKGLNLLHWELQHQL